MKRFLLFGGDTHYPSGGWKDFLSSHDTLDEVFIAYARLSDKTDWWQVVDTETSKIVEQYP